MSLSDLFPALGGVNLATLKQIYDIVHDGIDSKDIEKIIRFLEKYGYIESIKNMTIEEAITAIRRVRETYGIMQKDDAIDKRLLSAVSMPRCGVTDALRATNDGKWHKTELKYYIDKYLDEFTQAKFEEIVQGAFNVWVKHINDIKQISRVGSAGQADIIISTGRGKKDDFDGDSGTLAWAYLPPGNNSQLLMRYDEDELWSPGAPVRGIYCFNVSAHEFGHLLGLDHSRVSTALMAPYYSPGVYEPQTDDIKRIQALYGKKGTAPTNPTTPTTPSNKTVITVTGSVEGIDIPGYRVTKI